MWDIILKVMLLLPISVITLIAANIIPILTYRQNGDKNKLVLMDTLSRELGKEEPCAYLVESCVARLHSIRPISWAFLQVVLPCSHSLEIIQLVSSGRRILNVFDISVEDKRPVVQYAAAFSSSARRRNTMLGCILFTVFFLALLAYTEWQLLELWFENSLRNNITTAVSGDVLYLLLQMLIYAAVIHVFILQGLILKRSEKRLSRIRMLIGASFPEPIQDS